MFSLKFDLTEFLYNYGGHIGYAVKPSKGNCGLATQILKAGLQISKELGFDKLLAICDDGNLASEKVILHNGGMYENKIFHDEENVFVKRYWINYEDNHPPRACLKIAFYKPNTL